MVTGTTPVMAVRDVTAAVRFYEDVLGFTSSWIYGDPPNFAGAHWGATMVMFCHQPDIAEAIEGHQLWLDVKDVNALYATHIERGAEVISPLEDKPWGKREYTVRDLNGYHLRFAGEPNPAPSGTGVFPEGVRIERRVPTPEEYETVVTAAFGSSSPNTDLERTWNGVVALDPDGEAIGCMRIMKDAQGWFSAWEVGVVPEWQGRRIGSAMMETAAEMVREVSPGAWLFLFTYKGGFYERLGYKENTVHMVKV